MRPVVQTILASGIQPPIPLDIYVANFDVSQTLILGSGAAINFTCQFCNDDPFASYATNYNTNGNWISDPNMTGITTTKNDGIIVPCRAVRINVASFTAGTAPTTFTVVQAGVR